MGRRTDDAGLTGGGDSGYAPSLGGRGLRIGDWHVDASANVVERGDDLARLEPKVMEVLCFLAERPGEVVSRDELLARLWPGLVVGDDALTQAVIKLRRALGDEARSPRYIETVPKRGYRLVARAEFAEDAASASSLASSVASTAGSLGGIWVLPAVAVAAAVTLLAVGLWLQHGPDLRTRMTEMVTLAAETDSGSVPRVGTAVVVKPFLALGDHPGQRYLAEGLAAELAADLSRMLGVSVIRAEGTALDRAAPTVDSAFVVSGAVQRIQDRIAVEARLDDAATGHAVWSERYYRPFGDLFRIRDDIESRIAGALADRIHEAGRSADAHRYSRSLAAYDAFLQARAALLLRTPDGNERAADLYRQAVHLDAAFARAYGGLALIHAANYRNQWTEDGAAELRRALDMAETAAQIDPELPEAQWVLGYVHAQHRRHRQAVAHLDTALAAAPGYADAYALKGGISTYVGRPAASIDLLRQALVLKPSAGYLYYLLLGRAYFFLGDLEQAGINLEEALARNPANLEAHVYLAATLTAGGDTDAAQWEAEEILALEPDFTASAWLETYPMTDRAQIDALASTLGSLSL